MTQKVITESPVVCLRNFEHSVGLKSSCIEILYNPLSKPPQNWRNFGH